MLPPHLRRFSDLYDSYDLGAVKNIWLLTCLHPIARTVNLYKLKDYVGGVLEKENTQPGSHYKRLTRFFQDWGERRTAARCDAPKSSVFAGRGLQNAGHGWNQLADWGGKSALSGAECFSRVGCCADLLGGVGKDRGVQSGGA